MKFSIALEAYLNARELLEFECGKTPPSKRAVADAEEDLRSAASDLDEIFEGLLKGQSCPS